jgi:hypothetical protein
MNRRNFLGLVGGVSMAAAVRTWPFRVYSFPSEIVAPTPKLRGDMIRLLSQQKFVDLFPLTAKQMGIMVDDVELWLIP